MEVAPGYKQVTVLGVKMKIDGEQVYYHEGRKEYSIKKDNQYLVQPTDGQQRTIDAILDMVDDHEFADECERDKVASLHQTNMW